MKKKDITHPKLYFDFKNTNQGVNLFFYSNKIDESGKRLKESKLNTDITSFSHQELNKLNKVEYKKESYAKVKKHIDETYAENNNNYSSAMDILASYVKGHKIIYMESRTYSVSLLNKLMLPSIFLTGPGGILSMQLLIISTLCLISSILQR